MQRDTATTKFKSNVAIARLRLAAVAAELDALEVKQAARPRDWGFAGSAGYVAEKLTEAHTFLTGEEV